MKNRNGFVNLLLTFAIVLLTLGGLFYYSWQKGLIKATPPERIFPTLTTDIDEFANWKTYVDPLNRFSFRYPHDMRLRLEDNKEMYSPRLVGHSVDGALNIDFIPITKSPDVNLDLNEWYKNTVSPNNTAYYKSKITKHEPKVVDGYPGTQLTVRTNTEAEVILIPREIWIMEIDIWPGQLQNIKSSRVTQILSTFKFTD